MPLWEAFPHRYKILQQNGILTRYYALDKQQRTTHTVSGMAAAAIDSCLRQAGLPPGEVEFLAAATTQGDLPVRDLRVWCMVMRGWGPVGSPVIRVSARRV